MGRYRADGEQPSSKSNAARCEAGRVVDLSRCIFKAANRGLRPGHRLSSFPKATDKSDQSAD